ncbi:MAG: type 4a pilus biogenesis protein PilO [Candidatus Omnitrophica bacterium]|nr:type 4a pilus biogenesis protein PilO [Candidatus Omnitrophota bacterium]
MDLNVKLSFTKEDFLKNRILIIGIAIALISVWHGYNNIYKATITSIQKVKKDIYNEGVSIDISKRLSALNKEVKGYEDYFAKETDVLWLMDKVSRFAGDSGLKIISVNSRPCSPLKTFLYCNVNIVTTGTFHQLGDFISSIESSNEFMHVEKLSFDKSNESAFRGGEKPLSANIVIATYFRK